MISKSGFEQIVQKAVYQGFKTFRIEEDCGRSPFDTFKLYLVMGGNGMQEDKAFLGASYAGTKGSSEARLHKQGDRHSEKLTTLHAWLKEMDV